MECIGRLFFLSRRTITFRGRMSTQCLPSQHVHPVTITHRLCDSKRSQGLHPGIRALAFKTENGFVPPDFSRIQICLVNWKQRWKSNLGNSVTVVSALIPSAWGKGELDSVQGHLGKTEAHKCSTGKRVLFLLPCKPDMGLQGGGKAKHCWIGGQKECL